MSVRASFINFMFTFTLSPFFTLQAPRLRASYYAAKGEASDISSLLDFSPCVETCIKRRTANTNEDDVTRRKGCRSECGNSNAVGPGKEARSTSQQHQPDRGWVDCMNGCTLPNERACKAHCDIESPPIHISDRDRCIFQCHYRNQGHVSAFDACQVGCPSEEVDLATV